MKDIFKYDISENKNNVILSFHKSDQALEQIRQEILGKTALFTDRSDFSNEEIVGAYHSAWQQMKDVKHLTVRSLFHRTDQKIKIHLFTCVLAYRMCCLLVKELADHGLQTNVNQLIENMSGVKRVQTFLETLRNLNASSHLQSITISPNKFCRYTGSEKSTFRHADRSPESPLK